VVKTFTDERAWKKETGIQRVIGNHTNIIQAKLISDDLRFAVELRAKKEKEKRLKQGAADAVLQLQQLAIMEKADTEHILCMGMEFANSGTLDMVNL
jgi:hypothetical protein